MAGLDYRGYWEAAFSWEDYLGKEIETNGALWDGVWKKSAVPAWAREEAAGLGEGWKLLVISEDWCGDASNTVPVMARLAEAAPGIEMRVVKRDENEALMDEYLTNGSRSIPLVVVLDAEFRPVGRWGPRPSELQAFVLREKAAGGKPLDDLYREVRTWYARDKGESTIREILGVIASARR